jgi:hypothetical protein
MSQRMWAQPAPKDELKTRLTQESDLAALLAIESLPLGTSLSLIAELWASSFVSSFPRPVETIAGTGKGCLAVLDEIITVDSQTLVRSFRCKAKWLLPPLVFFVTA